MQNSPPLVTVIVLCYNHAKYLREAIQSVMVQDYDPVEIIIVDDASTDGSREVTKKILSDYPEIKGILLEENLGNCRAFNRGLQLAGGKYVIDLAADDLLLPSRITVGVRELESKGEDYGVHFCDAFHCNEDAEIISSHYHRNKKGQLLESVPQGEVYADLLSRYFICAPTMMIRKSVLDELGGYNEELSFEDFDFWIRSSRKYLYAFSDDILVKKRNLPNSLSKQQYRRNSKHFESTYTVCKTAVSLNRNAVEHKGLRRRILYEAKMCAKNFKLIILIKYLSLMLRSYL